MTIASIHVLILYVRTYDYVQHLQTYVVSADCLVDTVLCTYVCIACHVMKYCTLHTILYRLPPAWMRSSWWN